MQCQPFVYRLFAVKLQRNVLQVTPSYCFWVHWELQPVLLQLVRTNDHQQRAVEAAHAAAEAVMCILHILHSSPAGAELAVPLQQVHRPHLVPVSMVMSGGLEITVWPCSAINALKA